MIAQRYFQKKYRWNSFGIVLHYIWLNNLLSPKQKFFGKGRYDAGCNDHPSTPNYLQIYKILSLFSLIKPPTTGNCTVSKTDIQKPLISLSQLKTIFASSTKPNALEKIKNMLSDLVKDDDWEFEMTFEHDYSLPEITDCVIYYMTASLNHKLLKSTQCSDCSNALKQQSSWSIQEDQLNALSTKLVHPNQHLYKLIKYLECIFQKHCSDANVLDLVIHDLITDNLLSFPCAKHKADIVPYIIYNYINIRMQQFCTNVKCAQTKLSQQKRKLSKLCHT